MSFACPAVIPFLSNRMKPAPGRLVIRPGAGFLFEFPFFQLACQFVQSLVTVVTGLADLALSEGFADGAAGLFPVGAVWKLAMAEIRSELREGILQLLPRL